MKKVLHSSLSFVMALVVLFSTMSFTINKHYCGETLIDTAIFKQVKTCGMEQSEAKLPSSCSMIKKDCCSDEQQTVSGQDELQLAFEKITIDQHIFVAVFLHSYHALYEISEDVSPSINDYPPPIFVRQLFKLDETYLI